MEIESKIIKIINDKLRNPIFETLKLLSIKTILLNSNFSKRQGKDVYMVVIHFVYMLVMNKKLSTFMEQSNDSFYKDVYYRLLSNANYNWRKLLSLSMLKILKLVHRIQNSKVIRVFIIDDTVEEKVGKNIEGSCDSIFSNKAKRKVRGLNVISLNYSDGFSNFMLDFAISMNKYARVKIENFKNKLDHRTNAYKRRMETQKTKLELAIDKSKGQLVTKCHKANCRIKEQSTVVYTQIIYLLIVGIVNLYF